MTQPLKPAEPPSLPPPIDYDELLEPVGYDFGLKRRSFVQILGAGLLIASSTATALAQRAGGRRGGGGARTIGARIHLGKDGSITVLAGKVEGGQGARAELTQAAAEELKVAPESIQLILADTSAVPDDGITAGSGTTPRTIPAVREAAAAARQLLVDFAAKQWNVEKAACEMRNGKVIHAPTKRTLSYADLAANADAVKGLEQPVAGESGITPVKEWKVLGVAAARPNGRDIITGTHRYPSDIRRTGMFYGKILRPPSYGAKLTSIDLAAVKELKDVIVVRDDQFVGVAASSTFRAEQALMALARTAQWEPVTAQGSSTGLFEDLKKNARGGVPESSYADERAAAKKVLKASYQVAYAQHAPLEPRAAVAEWQDDQLTVWASTQNPFGHRSELARAFHLSDDKVRVIVPDFGAGFGGKHTGETSVEAARLAKGAGKPVSLRWTRQEEFTWAYFRPAGAIECEATLGEDGALTSWHFININSGPSAVETPYRTGKKHNVFVQSNPPLRHGSYRGLAATANTFARECFMDELAEAAGSDPLGFRLKHLENERLRAVLEEAARRFGWSERFQKKSSNSGVGLACGTEKGSYVAACVEIEIDRERRLIKVRRVCQVFECGAIINPDNLRKQTAGALIMGLGPALREQVLFENGKIQNASFRKYEVPRFDDVPELDIHLLNRPDLPSAGAGETPIIAIAPAIANAVNHASGLRIREMPIRLPA